MVYYVKRPCVQIFVLAYYKSKNIILNKHHLMEYYDYFLFAVFLITYEVRRTEIHSV